MFVVLVLLGLLYVLLSVVMFLILCVRRVVCFISIIVVVRCMFLFVCFMSCIIIMIRINIIMFRSRCAGFISCDVVVFVCVASSCVCPNIVVRR